jgi:large subunit ribosomal protein L6
MSRIGKQPVPIPKDVVVSFEEKNLVIKGPKGEIRQRLFPELTVELINSEIQVRTTNDEEESKALHGLLRSLIANAVIGVLEGFEKRLELVGTGYRVKKDGEKLVLSLGYSHPVKVHPLEGVDLDIKGQKEIIVKGVDKQLVGQVAADIRSLRKPEPYKGKGVRYKGEEIRLKPGKAAKVGVTGGA